MKAIVTAAALAGLLIVAARAQEGGEAPSAPVRAAALPQAAPSASPDWSEWTRPLVPAPSAPSASSPPAAAEPPAPARQPPPAAEADEFDVVDAHWMALTMWGEARGQGEEAMRAVGHVIHNRWQSARRGAFVTDTVSEAYQFSCWNEGDPNRAAMLNIHALPRASAEYRLWQAARRLAAEILAGRSADPTGGALFYHSKAVRPRWSQGVPPVAEIGGHLFFRRAR